jgi:hypothetical protein
MRDPQSPHAPVKSPPQPNKPPVETPPTPDIPPLDEPRREEPPRGEPPRKKPPVSEPPRRRSPPRIQTKRFDNTAAGGSGRSEQDACSASRCEMGMQTKHTRPQTSRDRYGFPWRRMMILRVNAQPSEADSRPRHDPGPANPLPGPGPTNPNPGPGPTSPNPGPTIPPQPPIGRWTEITRRSRSDTWRQPDLFHSDPMHVDDERPRPRQRL